jgi:hypothetical protein
MWSSISVPGAPRILTVDGTQNIEGWEHAFFDRLHRSLQRSGLEMTADRPVRATGAAEFVACVTESEFNCLLLFAHPGSALSEFWESIRLHSQSHSFLSALCSVPDSDPRVSEDALKSDPAVVRLAVVPLSPMSAREAGLFYLKFFTELKLHSSENITGKMVWFSFSKARELLRRRRYSARFGVRC